MHRLAGRYALRARYVFPVDGPPLGDGVVAVDAGRIRSIGPTAPDDCELIPLGNVALLPGLVNAHAHLDFSDLPVPLGHAGMSLPEWIELVVRRRRDDPEADTGARCQAAISAGHRESLAHGTTTLGDIFRDVPLEPALAEGIDYTAFLELIGLSAPRAAAEKPRLKTWAASRPVTAADGRWRLGISPHAPYSVRPELVALACRLSAKFRLPLAMHLAESQEEVELLARQEGPLVDVLQRLEVWDPTAIRLGTRPRDYLELLTGAHRVLVIHGNYLDAEERTFLARQSSRMAAVYCPRTHSYFGHAPYPLAELLASGATVALGTDGRGSSPDLSLLAEMRHAARLHPAVPPGAVLRLATLGGARALGCDDRVGSLSAGKDANLVVLPLPDRDEPDPHRLLLESNLQVQATIYRGQVVYCADAIL